MAAESSKTGVSALSGNNEGDDSDSDSSFQTSYHPTAHDRTVLEEAEQEEKLLGGHSYNDGGEEPSNGGLLDVGGRERRRKRRRRRIGKKQRRKGDENEDGSLMYEMEEGGSKDDADSQSSSSSLELDIARQEHAPGTKACPLSDPLAAQLTCHLLAPKTVSQPRHCHGHSYSFHRSYIRLIQDFSHIATSTFSTMVVQWNVDFWSYYYPSFSGRFPGGLSLPKPHTYA